MTSTSENKDLTSEIETLKIVRQSLQGLSMMLGEIDKDFGVMQQNMAEQQEVNAQWQRVLEGKKT